MPYKAYLENNEITFNPAEVSRLESLDALCNKCLALPKDELLCDGYRVYMDEEASCFYRRLNVYSGPCEKKREQIRKAQIMGRISRSGVPETVSKKLIDIERELLPDVKLYDGDDDMIVVNNNELPIMARVGTDDDTLMASWRLVTAINLLGVPAKWIWPKSIYQRDYRVEPEFWQTLFHKLTTQTEFLAVHRADMHLGADFKKEIFIKVLEYRLMHSLPTFLSIGEAPLADTEDEKAVYERILKLPEVKL